MKKSTKKLLSLIISIMMVTMLLPGQAAEAATTQDGKYTYSVSSGNATITGLANKDYSGVLTIPSIISDGANSYPVTRIGDYAFMGCSSLTGTLRIPDSVTIIGMGAFGNCSGLSSLTIGKSVTRIDNFAFNSCSGFTGLLTIPDNVTGILPGAFGNCSGITGVTIGSGLNNYGYATFMGCISLININVSNLNTTFSSKNGILYDKGQTELIQCPEGKVGQVTIPDSVTIIWPYAFRDCSGLSSVTIGNSVTRIEQEAFRGCSGLTGPLTIPDSVTRISSLAFSRCSGLSVVTIGNSVTRIDTGAFESCNTIKTIIAKPVNAPSTDSAAFVGVPETTVLHTPNTPSDNTSYNVEPWSLFIRGTLQPTAEVVSGVNRFDTAALISKRLNASANTVILTTGRNFPDALSAGPLAVQKNAPILLAELNKIPVETLNEITRLGASKVIILGGLGAMDSSVEATLKNLGLSVERISGATRFLTAIETAKQVRASSGQLDRAILANGYGFADALSIGSYAAKAGIPILLTAANSLSPETKTAMVQFGIKEIDIIGGELAVSKAVVSQLQAMGISVSRISGASRFATSSAIAGKYFAASENAIVSNGRGFVDALAAVPLAVKQNAPILLVEKDSLPVVMSNYLGSSIIKNITITGGELAVSTTVKNKIIDILRQ